MLQNSETKTIVFRPILQQHRPVVNHQCVPQQQRSTVNQQVHVSQQQRPVVNQQPPQHRQTPSRDTKTIQIVSSLPVSTFAEKSSGSLRVTAAKNYLKCVSCGNLGQWRKVTKTSVCSDCRIYNPEHRLLTRTRVLEIYGNDADGTERLTKDDLFQAYMKQRIRMYTVPNEFHNSKYPMRLYHQSDIEDLYRSKFPTLPLPKIPEKQWS